jgi:hypothetical protein
MKKQIVSLVAAVLFSMAVTSVSAQSVQYPSFHFGIRGGLTVNSASFSGTNLSGDSKAFPYGGLAADFKIAPIPLYLETGVYYMKKGYTIEENGHELKVDDHYIHMPLLVSYHIYINDNMAIQPFAGFAGGYVTKSSGFEGAVRLGCGINFGSLYANLGYDIGVTKNTAKGIKYSNNTFFATIGFNFLGSR